MSNFKVMNADWDIVLVKQINGTIHRHAASWREFKEEEVERLNARYKQSFTPAKSKDTDLTEIDKARVEYEEKFWKPVAVCKKNDLKWILGKLEA